MTLRGNSGTGLFLSTPSGWRATEEIKAWLAGFNISIHALRVEGDRPGTGRHYQRFYISIHALRVEGDLRWRSRRDGGQYISIHALRVEGDSMSPSTTGIVPGFLSTPSGWGATRELYAVALEHKKFLSTPSGWRATYSIVTASSEWFNFYPRPPGGGRLINRLDLVYKVVISIHALRVEGDDGRKVAS